VALLLCVLIPYPLKNVGRAPSCRRRLDTIGDHMVLAQPLSYVTVLICAVSGTVKEDHRDQGLMAIQCD
jgi:hypothetical protein